jgi:hypothetical protein
VVRGLTRAQIQVVCGEVDEQLNERAYILPGIGDFGVRAERAAVVVVVVSCRRRIATLAPPIRGDAPGSTVRFLRVTQNNCSFHLEKKKPRVL